MIVFLNLVILKILTDNSGIGMVDHNLLGEPLVAFFSKYTVTTIAPAHIKRAGVARLSAEERARKKLLDAIEIQKSVLAAEQAGQTYTIAKNDKTMKPRSFWVPAADGVAFTPRFGNEFLFEKGQGIVVADLTAIGTVLNEFAEAVQSGEFDQAILDISNRRGATPEMAVGETGAEAASGGKRRGRPKKV